MKRIATLLLAALLTFAPTPAKAEAAPIRLLMDGAYIQMDVPPAIISDRAMVPARAVFERAGGVIGWDGGARVVTIALDGAVVSLTVGAETAEVDGEPVQLDAPAQIIDGRTLIPLRFVSEAFGFEVDYYNRVVIILTSGAGWLDTAACRQIIDGKTPTPPETYPGETASAGALTVTTPVSRNRPATVWLRGTEGKTYDISVNYATGKSKAAGLEPKKADEDGRASWTWRVGGRTTPGTYTIVVTGEGERHEIAFTVRK